MRLKYAQRSCFDKTVSWIWLFFAEVLFLWLTFLLSFSSFHCKKIKAVLSKQRGDGGKGAIANRGGGNGGILGNSVRTSNKLTEWRVIFFVATLFHQTCAGVKSICLIPILFLIMWCVLRCLISCGNSKVDQFKQAQDHQMLRQEEIVPQLREEVTIEGSKVILLK